MSSPNQSQGDALAGTIVVLVDESSEMSAPIAGGTKSKAEGVATAVNSMLNQLTAGPRVRVAIVGYGGGAHGLPAAQIRWTGPLEGRVLVNSDELVAAPLTVEERIRRIPGPGGVGLARQETIQFPVWYVPQQSGVGGLGEVAEFLTQVLAEAEDDLSAKPPIILHVCAALPTAATLQTNTMQDLLVRTVSCHLHLGASDRIPATIYPSSSYHLPTGDVAALFDTACVLPDVFIETLRTTQVAVAPGARGLVYQAHMGDLIRFLMLAKAYAASGPEAFRAAAPAEPTVVDEPTAVAPVAFPTSTNNVPTRPPQAWNRLAFIVMVDRSQADPASGVWLRRQEHVNEMLARIAKRGGGDVDVAMVAYGAESVEMGFGGSLQGKAFVPDVELADGALRVEQITEKVSNGIGGLVEFSRSRPIFLEGEPSAPAWDLTQAVTEVTQLIEQMRATHDGKRVLPLIMHVTGGAFSVENIVGAGATLANLENILVYCTVVPENPQPTVAYPADMTQIAVPETAALWQLTSPLAGAERIAVKRSTINKDSRGFVVAAKFDLLLQSIDSILNPEP